MREHHAFGIAGSTRGVEENGNFVGRHLQGSECENILGEDLIEVWER